MIEKILDSGRSISEFDLAQLESRVGKSLPQTYKDFLLRNNGGRPRPMYFPMRGVENNPVGQVLDFFGIDDPIESCRIDWNYEIYKNRIGRGMLPIATDGGGNLICLSLDATTFGAIFYWSHRQEISNRPKLGLHQVSTDLCLFLESFFDLNPLDPRSIS